MAKNKLPPVAKKATDEIETNPKRKNNHAKHTMPSCFRILFSIVFLMSISVLFTWFVEYRHRMGDIDATWGWIEERPLVFSYSCVLMFLMLSFIVSLLWRTFFGTGLAFALISIVTYISMEKYKARQAPLLPEDFQMIDNAGEVASFVDVWGIVRLVLGVIFILIGSGLLEYYVRRHLGRNAKNMPWWQRWSIIPRTTFTLLSAVGLLMTTDFIINHEQQNSEYEVEWLNTKFIGWNQTDNYDENGFIFGFLYNIGRLKASEPENYSAETIAEIKARYEQVQEKASGNKLSDVVDNLIVVLDETFYDPELLTQYYPHTGGDPLPNLRKVFRDYPSGYMYSPEFGGGTANVEFEVFTGLTNYWTGTTPYTTIIPKLPSLESVASLALSNNFSTTAIHAYDGNVYKRYLNYQKMGFEEFIDLDKMTYQTKENGVGYVSDSAVYQEILDILKDKSQKHLVSAITMQNHAPYDSAQYARLDYRLTGYFKSDTVENSIQSLHYADEYLGDFLNEIDKLEEKTVVLWFGDHASGAISAYITSGEKVDRDLAHLTPYFIYANFDIESTYTVNEVRKLNQEHQLRITSKNVNLPTTTPNCLTNTLYNLLGIKKPTLMYVLDDVCVDMPILAQAYLENQEPKATNALKAYELITYDLLSGERYWYK